MKRKIHELFEAQVARDPEHIALIEDSCSISYQMLNIHVNQLAYHLRAQGLTEQQPVALCLSRGKRFLIGLLAIIKAGGTYLPLDPNQPEERLHYILKDAGADLLITDLPTQKKLSAFTGKFIIPEHEEKIIQGYPLDNPIWTSPIDNITYIIYTSGSTGTPKGVLIAESALINYCQWFAQYTNIQGKERIDFSANPIFDMAVTVSIGALLLGLTVVICPENIKRNPEKYLRYLHEQEINIIKLTPTYFKILLQAAHNTHLQLPELKRLILGGENLSANECKEWLDLYPDHVLHNEYGPTEATIAVTQYAISKNNYLYQPLNVPIGTPGNNMMCLIVDEHLNLVAPGEMGELIISGRGVARGYLNRPELNQQLFIRNPVNPVDPNPCYRTGDLCRINAQGIIEYYGRKDEQIKIRGFRIEPAEIENQLLLHPTVQNAAVVAQEINHFEPSLVAYIVLKKPQNEIQQEQFKQFLAQYLPDYMIPALFIKIPALPYNANGKLDKKALPKPQFLSKHKYAAPQTALEKKLISLWSAELGIPLPGIDDDFFELGGHSLSTARLIAQINHQLQINVDMQTFYQNANVRDLALKLVSHPKAPQPQFSANEEHYFNDAEIPLADLQFMMWMANTFEPKAKKLNIVARKRFKGHLDKNALDHAFSQLLRKHEVLHYQVAKLRPVQFVSTQLEWTYEEENIECLSCEHAEQKIAAGLNQLIQFQTWPKNKPALRAKLFTLNDTCELQLAMPHVLIDEASLDILFQDLSEFYSQHLRQEITPVSLDSHFKAYIKYEQEQIQSTLEGDISFWNRYFSDAGLLQLPERYIVRNMSKQKCPYSTYQKIPSTALQKLKDFCSANHITINNGLSAIVTLAIKHACGHEYQSENKHIVMNLIKSQRDNSLYDQSVGCILRVDTVKVALKEYNDLRSLAKQIRQSIIDTSNYQHCPSLIKFSAMNTLAKYQKKWVDFLIKPMAKLATRLVQMPLIYRNVINQSIARLMFFKRHKYFVINLNVRPNFINNSGNPTSLFGLAPISGPHQEDLLTIDHVLEVCFLYEECEKTAYIVVSGNLQPAFRTCIADEIIRLMQEAMTEFEPALCAEESSTISEKINGSVGA